MAEKTRIGGKPPRKGAAPDPEAAARFVAGPAPGPARRGRKPHYPGEDMARLTVDLPAALHRRARLAALEEGTTLAAVIRECLAKRFPEG